MACEKARKRQNPKKTYQTALVHWKTLPCRSYSPYGLEKSLSISLVTCETCLRLVVGKKI